MLIPYLVYLFVKKFVVKSFRDEFFVKEVLKKKKHFFDCERLHICVNPHLFYKECYSSWFVSLLFFDRIFPRPGTDYKYEI